MRDWFTGVHDVVCHIKGRSLGSDTLGEDGGLRDIALQTTETSILLEDMLEFRQNLTFNLDLM